jgi:hypothetical protein
MDSSCTAFVGACWDALAHTRDCEDPQAIRLGWRSSDAPAGDFIREPVDPSRWPHLLWRVDPGSVSSRIALACHIAVCHLYGKAETIAMLQERWGSVLELDPRPQGALFAFLRRTFVARTAKGRLGTFYHRGLADFVSVGSCYTMDSSCTAFVGACWDVFKQHSDCNWDSDANPPHPAVPAGMGDLDDPGSVSSRIVKACHLAVCRRYGKADTIAMLQARWGTVLELDPLPPVVGGLDAFLRRTFIVRPYGRNWGEEELEELEEEASARAEALDALCSAYR